MPSTRKSIYKRHALMHAMMREQGPSAARPPRWGKQVTQDGDCQQRKDSILTCRQHDRPCTKKDPTGSVRLPLCWLGQEEHVFLYLRLVKILFI